MDDKRTEVECQLRWRNVLHPDLSRKAFSNDEKINLEKWVKKFGTKGAWKEIAEKMQSRSALQCFTEWRKSSCQKDKGRAWTKEEDKKLRGTKLNLEFQTKNLLYIRFGEVINFFRGKKSHS